MTGYVLEALLDGVYTPIPTFADPLTIKRGIESFSTTWPAPTEFSVMINNDTLDYDPSRPTSLLYGRAGRNTRVRIRPDGVSRVYCEAQSWEPSRTPEHVPGGRRGKSTTAMRAAGLLERLSTWEEPPASPMYRTAQGRTTSFGHWSLEDDENAVSAANSLPGGYTAQIKGVTLAESERPFGAKRTVRLANGSLMIGRWSPASKTAGWQVFFSFKLATSPPSASYGRLLRWSASNGYIWTVDVNNAGYLFTVTDADGVIKWQTATGGYGTGVEPTNWVTFRMRVANAGGGVVNVQPAWYAQSMSASFGITDTFSGSVGVPQIWWQEGGSVTDGGWFSHVGAVTGVSDDLDGIAARRVFNGYQGETAIDRYLRNMGEAGLQAYLIGDGDDSMPMGPQPIDQLIKVLEECRSTEDGDLSDERFDIATTMRGRRDSYDMTPALELTYPDEVSSYVKSVGREGAWNRVTVKNRTGGELTIQQETGPMSVSPPPDGIGDLRRQIDVNVDDEATWLPPIASWHLAKGTLEGPRYKQITVDLGRHPELVATARVVREGDMITVDGIEPDLVRLLVVGIEERMQPGGAAAGRGTWRITYHCEPYDVYMVGVWDASTFRWGTNLSSLAAGATATATALSVKAADARGMWSTGLAGADIMIGGERMTVTSVVNTGTLTQTINVARSVNGIVKSHDADDPVRLFDGRRWGL